MDNAGIAEGRHPTEKQQAQIAQAFTYHAPKGNQPARYEEIRGQARALALTLVKYCPESRELSLALTKLEETSFWANASIARNE